MNLWATPVDKIGLKEVDDFLSQKMNEGTRLDYKAQVPKDLDKTIAAFANTLGGIIIIGVDEDSKNKPIGLRSKSTLSKTRTKGCGIRSCKSPHKPFTRLSTFRSARSSRTHMP